MGSRELCGTTKPDDFLLALRALDYSHGDDRDAPDSSMGCLLTLFGSVIAAAQQQAAARTKLDTSRGDRMIAEYFAAETEKLQDACLADIQTLDDWKAKRGEYRRQLLEMLGLDPLPERTDLKPVVTGKVEHEEFIVEKLHFQSRPGLYVTGNLYLPKKIDEAAAGDPLRLRPRRREDGRRQLRQQGRLSASRRLVRPQRLRLPDDRHAAARRDRGHPPRHAPRRHVVVAQPRLHAGRRRGLELHPGARLPADAPGGRSRRGSA